ncbi:hypothetical protein [Pseudodesulfovibrio sp.]|uniref:hypothetical protein n=1 Tax=unclassified Pseudodesulfovibrio TaxID=2661612 RepID=UPI003B00DB2A
MCTAILVAVALLIIVGALTVLRAAAPNPNAEMMSVLLSEMLAHHSSEWSNSAAARDDASGLPHADHSSPG